MSVKDVSKTALMTCLILMMSLLNLRFLITIATDTTHSNSITIASSVPALPSWYYNEQVNNLSLKNELVYPRKLPLIQAPQPESLSSSPGDWIITDTEVKKDEAIVLTGNLIVESGGNLTLINCTLYMNCTHDGEWQIRVNGGGVLNILENSNVAAYNPDYEFSFHVYGCLTIRDSCLSACEQLYVQTNEGMILSSSNITSLLIWIRNSSNITVTGCRIASCIHCDHSSNITIHNCDIIPLRPWSGAVTSLWLYPCSDVVISGCEIKGTMGCRAASNIVISDSTMSGIVISGSTKNVIISGCEIFEYGVVCWDMVSDIIISDCAISGSKIGVECVNWCSRITISNCAIFNNEIGVKCWGFSRKIIISNCTIYNNGHGIDIVPVWYEKYDDIYYVYGECRDITVFNCTIVDNGLGVYCVCSSDIEIHYCNIYFNDEHGLYIRGVDLINATYCWWDHPGGPEYKAEGDVGDPEEVYSEDGLEYLLYKPWLVRPLTQQPLIVKIVKPENGSCLRDMVNITAQTPYGVAINKVEFYINNTLVYTDYDAPYIYEWNITDWISDAEGKVVVFIVNVTAYSTDGDFDHDVVMVMAGDAEPPLVKVIEPNDYSYIRDLVLIKAQVSDNVAVDRVEFYINSTLVYTDYDAPYTYEWDTSEWIDGVFIINVTAYDICGNFNCDVVFVIVDNTAPVIGTPTISPEEPVEGENVSIRVRVTDALSGVKEVMLHYSTDAGNTWNNIIMALDSNGYYTATIPGQPAGTIVLYEIWAWDTAGNKAVSPAPGQYYSYEVRARLTPKPTPILASFNILISITTAIITILSLCLCAVIWRKRRKKHGL